VISVDLYARVRLLLLMHTRPRVHRAPGIPAHPLFFKRVRKLWQTSSMACCENANLCLVVTSYFSVIARSPCDEAIHLASLLLSDGIFAYARNDGFRLLEIELSCHRPA
jgi:hypothetical protein